MNRISLLIATFAMFAWAFSTQSSARRIKTAHGKWTMVWQETFSGRTLSSVWSRTPRGKSDWNNYMSDDPSLLQQKNGRLTLWGVRNTICKNDTAPYLTAGVWSKDRKTFHRGRIEVCAKLHDAQGSWPAIWLLPAVGNWPYGGEIDIMERLNSDTIAYQTVHSPFTLYNKTVKHKPQSGFTAPTRYGRYNVYGVELYEDSICFFINNNYTGTYRRQPEYGPEQFPFDRPMYLIIDMQLGGNWVGRVNPDNLPCPFEIDYVRYYRRDGD